MLPKLIICQKNSRSVTDYHLSMVINDKAIKKYGYDKCHERIIKSLAAIVENGVELNGKLHAVRLAYLQGDGLEKTFQVVTFNIMNQSVFI
jgi:hypothetical protein